MSLNFNESVSLSHTLPLGETAVLIPVYLGTISIEFATADFAKFIKLSDMP